MLNLETLGIRPLRCSVHHPVHGTIGYLVVNSAIHRRSVGGVRFAEDLTVEKVADLALTMTKKFGFLNMPCGGAKAGIIDSTSWSSKEREAVIRDFGASIGPVVRSGVYTPGEDLGFSSHDLQLLLEAPAGGSPRRRPRERQEKRSSEKTRTTGNTTALTVFLSGKLALEHLGIGTRSATASIEGFGKVGSSLAALLNDAGTKVIAVSNKEGTLYDSDGLEIPRLLELARQMGDQALLAYRRGDLLPRQRLFEFPVDALFPCAAQWVIDEPAMQRISCKVLSAGSNSPFHPSLRAQVLEHDGFIYIPDFVANCGGVLGGNMHAPSDARNKLIEEFFSQRVNSLLTESVKKSRPFPRVAEELATSNLTRMQEDPDFVAREARLLDLAYSLRRKAWFPSVLSSSIARRFAVKWLAPGPPEEVDY